MKLFQTRFENPPNTRAGRMVRPVFWYHEHDIKNIIPWFFIILLVSLSYLIVTSALTAMAQTRTIKIVKSEIRHLNGKKLSVSPVLRERNGKTELVIPRPVADFKPGKYKMTVDLQVDDQVVSTSQEFTWGVLAVNTNKSIYQTGDEAYLQMAALAVIRSFKYGPPYPTSITCKELLAWLAGYLMVYRQSMAWLRP